MRAEKIFVFLLIAISLIAGLFIFQKEFFSQNPRFKNLLKETNSQYLALREVLDKFNGEQAQNLTETINLPEFFLTKAFTLEQRIGQLFIVGIEGTEVGPETEELIKNFYPGGILLLKKNIENPEQLKKFINDLQALSLTASGLPLLIAVDQEGGVIDRIGFLKEKTAQSELTTTAQARDVGFQRGKELKGLGVNVNLAPLLDETKPGDFIEQRGFQTPLEASPLTGQKEIAESGDLASALILGQKEAGIFSAVKHFPGYTGIRFNPEERLATLPEIPETCQFKKAMEAEPEFVMTANVIYQAFDPELPFTFSSTSIQVLKDILGEKALLISDDLAQNSLLQQFTLKEIVTLPFKAGIDVLLFSGWRAPVEPAISAFREAVKAGTISEQEIDRRVIKIIQLKSRL